MHDKSFNFKISTKSLADIDNRINILTARYKFDKRIELDDKKRVISILSVIRTNLLDFHTRHDALFKLTKKYVLK